LPWHFPMAFLYSIFHWPFPNAFSAALSNSISNGIFRFHISGKCHLSR
jgi:hypothetical protein